MFELIYNLLFIWGLYKSFDHGEILGAIPGWYANKFIGTKMIYLSKPLFLCAPCMSSVWGIFYWFTEYPWWGYPIWVLLLTGASTIIIRISK
jgi:hypothetical protein